MSAPNFSKPSNASKYYAVLMGREVKFKECPDCNAKHYDWEYDLEDISSCYLCDTNLEGEDVKEEYKNPDDWEIDDLISNIGYEIEQLGGIMKNKVIGNKMHYGVQSLGYLFEDKSYGDIDLSLKVTAVIQTAYYEGATLDYIIELEGGYDVLRIGTNKWNEYSLDEALDVYFEDSYLMNSGMKKIQLNNAEKWAEEAIEEMGRKLENLFERWSEHKLICLGVASNGEAFYKKIN